MKPQGILLFLLSLFLILFGVWYFFPSKGVNVGKKVLRFPSYEKYVADLQDSTSAVDVDALLQAVEKSNTIDPEFQDSLDFFADYIDSNPNRIFLPEGDYIFFDSLFEKMEQTGSLGNTVRIIHYGDSQIEMDRISAILRQKIQERFGGSGPGMVPMIQRIPTVSLRQRVNGDLTRYTLVGDSLSLKASSGRYGPLAQMTTVSGNATFTFTGLQGRCTQPLVSKVQKVTVLLGNSSPGFTMTLKCDTLQTMTAVLDSAETGLSIVSWDIPQTVSSGTISFHGSAEIYGIALDGKRGVALDNVALRGCAGCIFSSIHSGLMAASLSRTLTGMIIMQFGGNAMPAAPTKKAISSYVTRIDTQFEYFRKVAPEAKLMFIGPADMCKMVDGELVSWPMLSQMNDSLRVHCLANGVAYWDMLSVMGGPGSMKEWVNHDPAFGGPDYIHFTTTGANRIGEALATSFLLYHDFYRFRRELTDSVVLNYLAARRDSLSLTPVLQ